MINHGIAINKESEAQVPALTAKHGFNTWAKLAECGPQSELFEVWKGSVHKWQVLFIERRFAVTSGTSLRMPTIGPCGDLGRIPKRPCHKIWRSEWRSR